MQKYVLKADKTEKLTKLWLKIYDFHTKFKAKLLLSLLNCYILLYIIYSKH